MGRPNRSTTLTLNLALDGYRETLDAFRELPREASDEMRDAATDIAAELAADVAAAGRREGRQADALAQTVKARRDRVPVIVIGGAKRLGRNRAQAYKLLFGSEFGASQTGRGPNRGGPMRQYRPHRGRAGYWIFPTVEDAGPDINKRWSAAADRIIERWAR